MTGPARQAEADRASVAFQVALTQIGAGTVEEALKLWQAVPVTARAATSTAWLKRAITLVMTRRRMSRDLARAYYRLVRALRTGKTVVDPYHPEPPYVTLETLRREFAELIGDAADGSLEGSPDSPGSDSSDSSPPAASGASVEARGEAQLPSDQPAQEAGADPDGDQIEVEELPSLREDEERIEREAEAEAREILEALGPANLERKTATIDTAKPAKDVDKAREEAHQQAGARQAATAERLVMNGGRSTVWNHMAKDRRVIGYIRLSRTGTPCGWCAMLISRGPVYKTQAKAGPSLAALTSGEYADGDKFHDNCHCYAEPVYSLAQYKGSSASSLYELNRRYEELWPKVTKGLAGKQAISAWRRFIRQEQKAAAQEARQSTTNVQEA
ncbi:hypothetical protein ADL35_02345 [Streptomyces sp. NRRL WC-3753]|nr:hypothetical protein ADL35_02345 [Streptomyces sp. NRRL WC-3753]